MQSEGRFILIIQHSWSIWTKESRAASAGRPRLDHAFALMTPAEQCEAWIHEISAEEANGFDVVQRTRAGVKGACNTLRWKRDGAEYQIGLDEPWEHRRVTPWPQTLPFPLKTVKPDGIVRIDWNGRIRTSLFGSNRSFYFEEHTMFLASEDKPSAKLFLDGKVTSHLDFRTKIY